MNILVTGAWNFKQEELQEIRSLGHEVIVHQQESDKLSCSYDWVEGVICNGLFLHHDIKKFSSLKYIQLTSAGFDRVPIDYISEKKITIYNARGVYSIPMAEHVLAGVLALYRKLFDFKKSQENCQWEKNRNLQELYQKRVFILGCGSVGEECAKRFKGFGCEVIGFDLFTKEHEYFDKIYDINDLDKHLMNVNIIVLTLPKTNDTINLIDKEKLAKVPDNTLICNIARGGIVNEVALEDELINGRISAYLDVFENEPLPKNSLLWGLPNVLLTPHNSFVGQGNSNRLFQVILNTLKGKK